MPKCSLLIAAVVVAGILAGTSAANVIIQNGGFDNSIFAAPANGFAPANANGSGQLIERWYFGNDGSANREFQRVDTDGGAGEDFQLKVIQTDSRHFGVVYVIDGADLLAEGFRLDFVYTTWGASPSGFFELSAVGYDDGDLVTLDLYQFTGSASITGGDEFFSFSSGTVTTSGTFSQIIDPATDYDNIALVLFQGDFQNGTATGGTDSISFDNFVATNIPEPAALTLLGLGAMAVIRRRRIVA